MPSATAKAEAAPREYRRRQDLVVDRLSADGVAQLVAAFQEGTKIRELVGRFSLSESSVKRILREKGVRRYNRAGST